MIARSPLRSILGTALVAVLCAACASEPSPRNVEVTHDGLVRVANSRVERAWIKPDVDFSQYTEVGLLDAFVSFRRNWRMNHSRVRTRDMERIKTTLAEEFRRIFTDSLQSGGYPVVTDADDHVLLIRPAIIDLDVAAPDTMSAGRSTSFTASPGAMTLVIELYDSVSNEILARAIDRRRARNVGNIQWATSGSNREAARRILRRWANLLVSRLDEVHHGEPGG
ncbi:MAG: DUF3313 family protein [Deltaproteobacteria bacterium]|nr:DUF3313 family protein [Deltaproteobacteria bacterium]